MTTRTTRPRESRTLARLAADQPRRGGNAGVRAAIQSAPDPFLSPSQEQALFVELKRRGVVRAKAGFGDIAPFLTEYKAAIRSADSQTATSAESAACYLVVQLEPGLHRARVEGLYCNIVGLPGVRCVVRGDFAGALREVGSP